MGIVGCQTVSRETILGQYTALSEVLMERRSTRPRLRRWLKRSWLPISAPQAQASHWLRLAQTQFSARLIHALTQRGLIRSEWEVLRQLYRPVPSSPLALARAIGMTKGGTSKVISRLVEKGLVSKARAYPDRRGRTVELTRAGKRLVPDLASLQAAVEAGFFSKLQTRTRHTEFMDALKRLLGAEEKRYVAIWVTPGGWGGQWAHDRTLWQFDGS
jgi:DNA-binding MarR family transcriptional regulator